MTKEEFYLLIDKYLIGDASSEEEQLLLNFLQSFQGSEQWNEKEMGVKHELEEKMLNRLMTVVRKDKAVKRLISYRWLNIAAAIVFLLVSGTLYVGFQKEWFGAHEDVPLVQVVPGGNKAVLTLSDGSKIILDSVNNEGIINLNGVQIASNSNGSLEYISTNSASSSDELKEAFNIIETPVGGQYQVVLPDGTKVWLNALSSIKYPVVFNKKERKVELTGEAYFEVAKDKAKPFKVITDQQEVEVLGTHFNVNSYPDEASNRTTLLEGSVKVTAVNSNKTDVLKPGEQAQVNGQSFEVRNVNVESVVDWKNGLFVFDNVGLKTSMRKIAKWYDVEVIYQGNFDDIYFGGSIVRSSSLSEILKILEATGNLKFKIEGRRVTVMP